MSIKCSIIIPVFNKLPFTQSCIKDLSNLSNEHELIIIDNGSTDKADEICQQYNQKNQANNNLTIRYFYNSENLFHSRACNQGFKEAVGEVVLFLNNDIKITKNHTNWIDKIIDGCQKFDGLVGKTMGLLDDNLNFVKEANQQLNGKSYLAGWCIAGKKEIFQKLATDKDYQVWNEKYPFYYNDTDLSFRARKKNIPLKVIEIPELLHFGKVSAQQINISKLYKDGRSLFINKWKK